MIRKSRKSGFTFGRVATAIGALLCSALGYQLTGITGGVIAGLAGACLFAAIFIKRRH